MTWDHIKWSDMKIILARSAIRHEFWIIRPNILVVRSIYFLDISAVAAILTFFIGKCLPYGNFNPWAFYITVVNNIKTRGAACIYDSPSQGIPSAVTVTLQTILPLLSGISHRLPVDLIQYRFVIKGKLLLCK